jgi:hypothetical protein
MSKQLTTTRKSNEQASTSSRPTHRVFAISDAPEARKPSGTTSARHIRTARASTSCCSSSRTRAEDRHADQRGP